MTPWYCEGCRKEVVGKIRRGRCESCYRKHLKELRASGADLPTPPRKYGPTRKPTHSFTVVERIFQRTTPGWGGCVLFTGCLSSERYGFIKSAGRMVAVHRQVYMNLVGPIPAGMVLDHTCHSSDADCPGGKACLHRRCVNPNHLEPVTPAENNMRGRSLTAANFLKTHCVNGHPFTPENTRPHKKLRIDGLPQRYCRQCGRDAARESSRRKRKRR